MNSDLASKIFLRPRYDLRYKLIQNMFPVFFCNTNMGKIQFIDNLIDEDYLQRRKGTKIKTEVYCKLGLLDKPRIAVPNPFILLNSFSKTLCKRFKKHADYLKILAVSVGAKCYNICFPPSQPFHNKTKHNKNEMLHYRHRIIPHFVQKTCSLATQLLHVSWVIPQNKA